MHLDSLSPSSAWSCAQSRDAQEEETSTERLKKEDSASHEGGQTLRVRWLREKALSSVPPVLPPETPLTQEPPRPAGGRWDTDMPAAQTPNRQLRPHFLSSSHAQTTARMRYTHPQTSRKTTLHQTTIISHPDSSQSFLCFLLRTKKYCPHGNQRDPVKTYMISCHPPAPVLKTLSVGLPSHTD